MTTPRLHLDFETYSEVDLRTCGVYKYAEHPKAQVLIAGYSFDDEPIEEWNLLSSTSFPGRIFTHVKKGYPVVAWNAPFEYVIWNHVLVRQLGTRVLLYPEQMDCVAARAARAGWPRALEKYGAAARQRSQKDKDGQRLIQIFCKPRKPTKADPSTRILPRDDPFNFKRFVNYCKIDVKTEREADHNLPRLATFDKKVFTLDFKINQRGFPIDMPMVEKAQVICDVLEHRLKQRAKKMTGGIAPTQVAKLKEWFESKGVEMENLQSATIRDVLAQTKFADNDPVKELLLLRVEAGKVSTKKLNAMTRVAMKDNVVRGCIMYYGAGTGRFSGKLVQPHNYIRGNFTPAQMDVIFRLIACGDADILEALYENPLTAIGQVMRGFIMARKGKRFIVVDYSAIEARILAWLAGDTEMIEAFFRGEDVYILMATRIWKIKPEEVTTQQRKLAKDITLGCGYGMGYLKFILYAAKGGIFLTEQESFNLVMTYRRERKASVRYWGDVERAMKHCIRTGERVELRHGVAFFLDDIYLCVQLPSGRVLFYPYPRIAMVQNENPDDPDNPPPPREQVRFMQDFHGHWLPGTTYGGKMVENIVQACACDVMMEGAFQMEANDYPVNGTVHDELIAEMENGKGSAKELEKLVCVMPKWADGAPIAAKAFETIRYRKD